MKMTKAVVAAAALLVTGVLSASANTYDFNEAWNGSSFSAAGASWMTAESTDGSNFTITAGPANGWSLAAVYYAAGPSGAFTPSNPGDFVLATLVSGGFQLGSGFTPTTVPPLIAKFTGTGGTQYVADGVGIPDASSTVFLLGCSFLAIGAVRRKFARA